MGDEGIYSLEELFTRDIPPSPPIIEKILWEKDNVLIVGHEKAGKSILGLQLAFAITSGQPLFGEYAVPNPKTVLYVQTEGKLPTTVDRAVKMNKINEVNAGKCFIAYYPHVALDTAAGLELFRLEIEKKKFVPEVIIIDPLYHAMKGSLIDEVSARNMTSNLRELMERYNATIVVIHHTHKPIRGSDGHVVTEGDGAIFGSFVWKSWADHTFLFSVDKSKTRILTCTTQRSGDVVEREELRMVDKESGMLGFERKIDELKPYEVEVRRAIEGSRGQGITRDDISFKTKLSMSSVEKSLRKLLILGEINKDATHRPVKYFSRGFYTPVLQSDHSPLLDIPEQYPLSELEHPYDTFQDALQMPVFSFDQIEFPD